jgi:hypothetical protein
MIAPQTLLLTTFVLLASALDPSPRARPLAASPPATAASVCAQTAQRARTASVHEAKSDYYLALGACLNVADPDARAACIAEAYDALDEALELADDQYEERLDLCSEVGGGPYDPEIDPDDFVAYVDHPFFPLVPGTVRTYEKVTDEGTETVVVTVTHETKEILGVQCVVVRDTVTLDGELIEDTFDYFAQDEDGNVWYFGELSRDFEEGEIASLEGTWRADRDGAKAGIIMLAAPEVGDVYRQEFALGVAEDAAEVLSLNATVHVPFGTFAHCLKTEDFSPMDPDAEEHKFYAAGIGAVLEVNTETGERLELISVAP